MKYRVTLNNKVYEIEVERGNAILTAEYDVKVPKNEQIKPLTPPPEVKKEEIITEDNKKTEENEMSTENIEKSDVQNSLE